MQDIYQASLSLCHEAVPTLRYTRCRTTLIHSLILCGTTSPLRKIRQRESAVPKHRYRRYQIADIINYVAINIEGNRSSTTHTPALSVPSCLMMPAFCIADKSLSIVLDVTDKVSDICLAETAGFDWIMETITRWRLVSLVSGTSPTFISDKSPTLPPRSAITSSTVLRYGERACVENKAQSHMTPGLFSVFQATDRYYIHPVITTDGISGRTGKNHEKRR